MTKFVKIPTHGCWRCAGDKKLLVRRYDKDGQCTEEVCRSDAYVMDAASVIVDVWCGTCGIKYHKDSIESCQRCKESE